MALVASIPIRFLTLDMYQIRLALPVDNKRRQLPSTNAPRIETIRVLMYIEALLPVMPINHRGSALLLYFFLTVIPELFPRCARMFATRDSRLKIDSAHVHNMKRVLMFERRVGDEAGVYGYEVA